MLNPMIIRSVLEYTINSNPIPSHRRLYGLWDGWCLRSLATLAQPKSRHFDQCQVNPDMP